MTYKRYADFQKLNELSKRTLHQMYKGSEETTLIYRGSVCLDWDTTVMINHTKTPGQVWSLVSAKTDIKKTEAEHAPKKIRYNRGGKRCTARAGGLKSMIYWKVDLITKQFIPALKVTSSIPTRIYASGSFPHSNISDLLTTPYFSSNVLKLHGMLKESDGKITFLLSANWIQWCSHPKDVIWVISGVKSK